MDSDIQALLYQAEDHYLQSQEIVAFKQNIASLKKRSETYKYLRDQEIDIFQPVADRLSDEFPELEEALLAKALKHWLSVLRYAAMAMLLNNPEYLQHRLLEWLTPQVQTHQLIEVEIKLYEFLESRLQELLVKEQLALIKPFLTQTKTTLLENYSPSQVGA